MSLHKVLLLGLLIALFAVAALVSFVLWSGRGILENPRAGNATDTEWMTVTNGTYEFRGTVYRTAEALSTGLLQLQPKPQLVSVRWVASGSASPPGTVPSTEVQQALEALLEAHIATPSAVVGNEIFVAEPTAASSAH
jgi:hypothetical protein